LEKGEFEKTIDYQNRIKLKSDSAFHAVCKSTIDKVLRSQWGEETIKMDYDADQECFDIHMIPTKKVTTKFLGMEHTYSKSVTDDPKAVRLWSLRAKVPVDQAPGVKERLQRWYYDERIRFTVVNELGGAIILQGAVFRYEGSEYEMYAPIEKGRSLVYSTETLRIQNEYLPHLVFDYNAAAVEEEARLKEEERSGQERKRMRNMTYQ